MLSHVVDAARLTIWADHGLLALEQRTARTVRIRYTLAADPSRNPSLTVTVTPSASASLVTFRAEEAPDTLVLSTDALCNEIDRRTLAFTHRDSAGKLLTQEPARGGKALDATDVLVSVFDQAT